MKTRFLQALLLLTVGFAGVTQAAPIKFSIDGIIDSASPGNAFGLSVGDTVSAFAIFDDSLFTGVGDETIFFGAGTGNSMTHEIGAITFVESMDVGFSDGEFPLLFFQDGIFAGWDFVADNLDLTYDAFFFDFFAADSTTELFVAGTWDPQTGAFTRVPEPGTLLLLATALLAFGFQRRRG